MTPSSLRARACMPSSARLPAVFMLAAALAACGGGDDDGPTATVTSTNVTVTRYGAPALLTINGANLDHISVSSAGCKDMTRLTTPPTASTSTTAYYGCTVSGAFSSSFAISSNGVAVGSAPFVVKQPQVTLTVNNTQLVNGNIVIALAGDKVPVTVDNFLAYVNSHYYDGQIFDRVVPGFVAQAGIYGQTVNGTLPVPKPTDDPIPLELDPSLMNVPWSIAMARLSTPDSATAEFYFNLANNTNLDGQYAVFGNVVTGTEVIESIVAAPATCTDNPLVGTHDCLPIPNVRIVAAMQTQ
jgi:peptidyl-prolyl cis-trans isomerase A (cyclophilin A)